MLLAGRGLMSGPGHQLFPGTVGASGEASLDSSMCAGAGRAAFSPLGLSLT